MENQETENNIQTEQQIATETIKDNSDALIFIDTNVFLDFYRIRNADVSMKLLDEIVKHKDSIIMTTQVEMEFKKNRQIVFGESYTEIKKNRNVSLNLPHILTVEEEVKDFNETKKKLNEYQSKLEKKFEDILTKPIEHDRVYIKLEELFSNKSPYNLNRDNIANKVIAESARDRFDLGYPPRKNSDNSIGDAINWEWIIQCAKASQKSVILITRDSDFGYIYNNEPYLNDWLAQEFKERVEKADIEIVLTNKLTKAFKIVNIEVTKQMEDEEREIISTNEKWAYANVREVDKGWIGADRFAFNTTNPMASLNSGLASMLASRNSMQSLSPGWTSMTEVMNPKPWLKLNNDPNSWESAMNKPWLLGLGKYKP